MIETEMLLAFIKSRRTTYRFLDKSLHPVKYSQIQSCLEAAIWAPNHKLTEPWRFWVVGSSVQLKLAAVYARNRASKRYLVGSEAYEVAYEKALVRFNNFPAIVFVGQVISKDSVVYKEDYAACACAIQNFQLMAWQQSIGVQWSTGPIIKDLETYKVLGCKPEEIELIGALYLGQVEASKRDGNTSKRRPVSQVSIQTDFH